MKILQIKSYYEFKNNPSSSKNKELTWTIRHLSETTTIIIILQNIIKIIYITILYCRQYTILSHLI